MSARAYIVGAGMAGRALARDIAERGARGTVVAFFDDDDAKIGTRIEGLPVMGPIADVAPIVEKGPLDEAIIAMPSTPRDVIRRLYHTLKNARFAHIRILPSVSQIVGDDAHFVQTRTVDPQDLLGRTPVSINLKESLAYLRGKRVLVTGAGGSIGSELARQLLFGGVERLYLLGHGENSIYQIDSELRILQNEGVGERSEIVPIIGDLDDEAHMKFLLARLRADVVFHAAAFKHVPMMESNPVAAVRNNVFGTRNLLRAANESGVKRLVLVSTDKAVEPSSTYGATKHLAEKVVLDSTQGPTLSVVVRFGNVLGSRGSVLPLFRRQIENGGPVTVTDPDATRYFMTIPEAVSLVLRVGGLGERGRLYLLDMGDPVRIMDLAEQMIRFYGYEPRADIAIETIGLRAGEKRHEALLAPCEKIESYVAERVMRVIRVEQPAFETDALLEKLRRICYPVDVEDDGYRNRLRLRRLLEGAIPSLPVNEGEPEY